jgi:hypothetical protein
MSWIKPKRDTEDSGPPDFSQEENVILEDEISPFESESEYMDSVVGATSYLEDEPLSQEFENQIESPITVHFCFYNIADDLITPFLEFYMEKNEGFYGFPNTTVSFPETHDSDMYDLCVSEIQNYFPIVTRENYKGFLDVGKNTFVMVIHTTSLEFTLENHEGRFAILDEILYKKNLSGEPIEPLVKTLFQEHEYMKFILDQNRHPLPLPVCLYAVEKKGMDYENSFYEEGSPIQFEQSGLDIPLEHPIFGSVFFFSTQPLESTTSPTLKRFAGFLQDTLYILNKNFELEENLADKKDEFHDFSGVVFYEKGVEYVAFFNEESFLEL